MRERPIAVLIFGILNILFAFLGFVGVLLSQAFAHMGASGNAAVKAMNSNPAFAHWTHIQNIYTGISSVALLVAGIGLLLLQNWARLLSLIYAGIDIIVILVSAYFSQFAMKAVATQTHVQISPQVMGAFMLIGLVFGTIIKLAYPVLLLIFLTRPKVCQSFQPMLPPPPAV